MSISDTQPQHEARDERHRFSHIYHADLVAMAEIGPSSLMVYAFIAKYADYRSRKAFPSIDALAQDCNLSRNTVMKAIRDLSKAGLLKVTKEKTPNGYQKSTYTLMSKIDKARCKNSTELGAKIDKSLVQKLHPNDTHVNDTHINENIERVSNSDKTPDDLFEEFWDAYGKKINRPLSVRSFAKAIKRTDLETMLTAIEVQKKSRKWRDGYQPNPSTWLNGDGWDDELEPISHNQGGDISPSNQKQPEPAKDVDWGPDPNLAWMLDPSLPKPWEKDNG